MVELGNYIENYENLNKQEARRAINGMKQRLRNSFFSESYECFKRLLEMYPQDNERELLREVCIILLGHFENNLELDCLKAIMELLSLERDDTQIGLLNAIVDCVCKSLPKQMQWVNSYKTITKAREKLEIVIARYEQINAILKSDRVQEVITKAQKTLQDYQGKGKNPFYEEVVEITYDYTYTPKLDENYKKKAINELLGMCRMLSAGVLSKEQVDLLQMWLTKNDELKDTFPISHIRPKIEKVLEDGIIDEQEKQELLQLFDSTAGVKIKGAEGLHNKTITLLPFEEPNIKFAGMAFCLTGDFQTGSRKQIEQIIKDKGGVVKKGFSSSVRYLVVGLLASDAYKYGNFGSKIEKAMELKKEKGDWAVRIISEEWLVQFL